MNNLTRIEFGCKTCGYIWQENMVFDHTVKDGYQKRLCPRCSACDSQWQVVLSENKSKNQQVETKHCEDRLPYETLVDAEEFITRMLKREPLVQKMISTARKVHDWWIRPGGSVGESSITELGNIIAEIEKEGANN